MNVFQSEKSQRGGARPGAGRKPGGRNTRTAELVAQAAAAGMTPVEFMLRVMRDEANALDTRMDAAKAAAPYVHPRLAAVEHTGKDGEAIKHAVVFEVIGVPPQG